jgi:hypothetical protein
MYTNGDGVPWDVIRAHDRLECVDVLVVSKLDRLGQDVIDVVTTVIKLAGARRPGCTPSGNKRTRLLEKVLSKMPPGHRLQAVACLQVLPDWELLDWLAR